MLDELLYGVGRKAFGRFRKPPEQREGAVELADVSDRLQVLASVLCRRSIAVVAADGVGGMVSGQVYLPAKCALFASTERNRESYLLRLIFGLALDRQARQLFAGIDARRLSQAERIVATAALWPRAEASMVAEFPGLAGRWRQLLDGFAPEPLGRGAGLDEAALRHWTDALHKGLPWEHPLLTKLQKDAVTVSSVGELTEQLQQTVPRRFGLWRRRGWAVPQLFWFSGLVCNPSAGSGLESDVPSVAASAESLSAGTERQGKSREDVQVEPEKSNKEEENPILHLFEKIETAEEYNDTKRVRDASDEMAEHGEALDELNLNHVVRSEQGSGSLYRADLALGSPGEAEAEADPDPEAVLYDEWDGRRNAYRRAHCRVYPILPEAEVDPQRLQAVSAKLRHRLRRPIQELRAAFTKLAQMDRLRSRQRDGDELDLDAFVDDYGTRRVGRQASDRIWWRRRPQQRDTAVLVLIDGSLSADAWVAERRVLDVARESSFMLGEVLQGHKVEFAVAAFHSCTRHDCRFLRLKDFGQEWRSAMPRLFAVKPHGYTRIGPALRHGRFLLNQTKARRKLMLVLTDGKATDYDRYEGRYGRADVRQSVREAARDGVTSFALAIAKDTRHDLPRMFGSSGYQVMPRPELLPDRMALLLERFVR